ncbi:hypothetical protein [Streptomyces anulatus]|uniref:hypothetical protein n=1 Tax=Streptomyces anulatus TaxID=1892 RepID=UPI0036A8CD1D
MTHTSHSCYGTALRRTRRFVFRTVTQSKTNGDPLPADFPSRAGGWETVYFYAAYVPLVLWGPMLGILTYAYWRRRGSATTGPLLLPTVGTIT